MGRAQRWFQKSGGVGLGRTARLALGFLLFLMASEDRVRGQVPKPRVSGEAATRTLARYVPRQDLVFFLEFDGLDSRCAAWRASAAYKLLNETKLGALIEDLAAQGIDLAQQSAPAEQRVKASDIIGQLKSPVRRRICLRGVGNSSQRFASHCGATQG